MRLYRVLEFSDIVGIVEGFRLGLKRKSEEFEGYGVG